ncbi:hypothetical protein GCM10010191_52520 [Actinomadura vinacea]|uniref:Uncharacterized protein n=1 Tax=Actinomadura vinacea TaxID=115336 RepID=A0ABP5WSA9_9ACTN
MGIAAGLRGIVRLVPCSPHVGIGRTAKERPTPGGGFGDLESRQSAAMVAQDDIGRLTLRFGL